MGSNPTPSARPGDARVLYFSGEALEVLRRLARVPHISKKVFVGRRGRAIFPRTAWEKALKDAQIEDFRFHDLRHTAITWQAMTGISVPWLQVFSGHKTSPQLDRYVHLAKDPQLRDRRAVPALRGQGGLSRAEGKRERGSRR